MFPYTDPNGLKKNAAVLDVMGGKPLAEVARDNGITVSTLRAWINEAKSIKETDTARRGLIEYGPGWNPRAGRREKK